MTKTIIALAAALSFSTVAYAEGQAPVSVMDQVNIDVVTDTEYNITSETTNTEFGIEAGMKGFTLSAKPNYDWDASDISNIEFGVKYDFKATDKITLTPYGEYNVDKDFNEVSKIVGVKTKFSL